MTKLFYIVDCGDYGNGDAVSLHFSKRGNVMAEYTAEPRYFSSFAEADEFLQEVKESAFDYNFSCLPYIRNAKIHPENLEIREIEFEIEEDEEDE